jgi:D-sedoheptulose 7-phosphate isomerase
MALEDELSAHEAALRATVARGGREVARLVDALCGCFSANGKVLVCGNGGSAADAQHIAAEFMNRLRLDRAPLAAVALTTDTSVLTCISNDSSYQDVFARQVEALGKQGDVVIALSTSGRSANVLAALRVARQAGLLTVGFTSEQGAEQMGGLCDVLLAVPSGDCARIQECHEFLCHVVAGEVEARMFAGAPEGSCIG